MSKMKVHAIVGTGSAPTKVIQEGLRDGISTKDAVSLIWLGSPTEAMEDVYDYIMEHEIAFQMFYADGTTPARVFRESEHGAVQKVRDPYKAALQSVENGGKVLFLWNEDDDDNQIDPVFEHIARGTLVLELSNGLAPISMDMDIPEPVDPVVAKDEDEPEDDTSFTKDELEIMTPYAVKRYGERMGCAAKTKSGIIQELFPDSVAGEDEEGEAVEPTSPAVSAAEAPAPAPLIKEGDPALLALLAEEDEIVRRGEFDAALARFTSSLTDVLRLLYRS